MKRFLPLVVLVGVLALGWSGARAATNTAPKPAADRSPGSPVASAVTKVTGIAISPLLGTSAYGAYKWFAAKDDRARAALPWFAQMSFWLPALLLVAACAAKDAFGAVVPPGMKKPLDVLETFENKASGLVAAGAVVPVTMASLSKLVLGSQVAHAWPAGSALHPLAAIDFSWLLNILTIPFGVAVFAVVWMASHAITVLILLSPWGAIDAVLKSARTALLGVLTITATFNPWLSAGLSLVVIVIAYFVAGWAFRLTVFGSVFCWDFLTLRRYRFQPAANGNRMFAGGNLPQVPVRTYGKLVKNETGECAFAFRPWLWLPERAVPVGTKPAAMSVGKGLFFSTVMTDESATLFLLPPRYRGHEETVAQAYALGGGVKPAGLRKAWSLLRELFGGGVGRTQVA